MEPKEKFYPIGKLADKMVYLVSVEDEVLPQVLQAMHEIMDHQPEFIPSYNVQAKTLGQMIGERSAAKTLEKYGPGYLQERMEKARAARTVEGKE